MPLGRSVEEFEQLLRKLDIWFFLQQAPENPACRQLSVQAYGGYGKTTLMKHIAYMYGTGRYAEKQVKPLVPFFVRLRRWGEHLGKADAPRLAEFLEQVYLPDLELSVEVPTGWVEQTLREQALLLFDGFDEVPEGKRAQVGQWLGRQMRGYPEAAFVVTSRPSGFEDFAAEDAPKTGLFVRPFSEEQREDFVRRWYECQEMRGRSRSEENRTTVQEIARKNATNLLAQIERRPELRDMAGSPLMLNMIAEYHRAYQGNPLPPRRGELYQEIFQLQLRSRPRDKGIKMLLPDNESQAVLQVLALEMLREEQTSLPQRELVEKLGRLLAARETGVAAKPFLQQIVQVAELMVERELREFEFSHLSFQEFLAAAEVRELRLESELLEHADDPRWQGTIVLYAALVNPNQLLKALLEKGEIELAEKCLRETPRQVDEDVRGRLGLSSKEQEELRETAEKVRDARFQKLEELMASGQWREADRETERVMLRTVGKEEGQYLDSEDLANFPCEELREIDRLWVEYSQGKWGFSVQKRIWQECGSPKEYGDEWEQFCDSVQWRKAESFVGYRDFNFGDCNTKSG